MKNFAYVRAGNTEQAVAAMAQHANAKFLGGGTNLVDLMRENIEQPDTVIDVGGLGLDRIEPLSTGGVSVGAAVKNTALANDPLIRERYPFLAQAVLFGASGQIRNMATVAGNLMQRTRCPYFYDHVARCSKREPGSGCDAIGGFNRNHAILGATDSCIATHPSDMCVALAALDAVVRAVGKSGERSIPFNEFHRLPGDTPHIETALKRDELITSVELPPVAAARLSVYRKIRDRASYAFALVSVAAAIEFKDDAIIDLRLALGGVAPKPWRAFEAERVLAGAQANPANFLRAAQAELTAAKAYQHNGFKIELAQRAIVDVLNDLTQRGPAR